MSSANLYLYLGRANSSHRFANSIASRVEPTACCWRTVVPACSFNINVPSSPLARTHDVPFGLFQTMTMSGVGLIRRLLHKTFTVPSDVNTSIRERTSRQTLPIHRTKDVQVPSIHGVAEFGLAQIMLSFLYCGYPQKPITWPGADTLRAMSEMRL